MTKLRVNGYSISLDGYGAGPRQTLQNPLGEGGMGLHAWMIGTRTFKKMFGNEGGTTGIDDDFAARAMGNLGAWILGRNMFSASRGPWPPNDPWKGWWGDNPPYHVPVFVLSHHPRPSITMQGGTVFHFVTEGIHEALKRAREVAKGRDIRVGGGASTVRQYLKEKLIDEMHIAISPVLLGSGEALFTGLDLPQLGYQPTEHVATEAATHIVITKKA